MDFDDAKENIQPLASGRDAAKLETALHAESDKELQEQLMEERKKYEDNIHNYVGDDPLEPWYEYIQWVEQCCPKSGKESSLVELLEKCLSKFETDERYIQDRRMVKLYIRYFDEQKNPQDYCEMLCNKGIGTMVSDLYIFWAHYYDYMDNFQKTEEIYQKGLRARAQPLDILEQAHNQFGFSMSQRILYKDDTSRQKFLNTMDEQRQVLTSLRTHKHRVGSLRTGHAIKSHNPGRVEQAYDAKKSIGRNDNKLTIYHNENEPDNGAMYVATTARAKPVSPSSDSNGQGTSVSVVQTIMSSTRKQENNREPGPWSAANSKKKLGTNAIIPTKLSCNQRLAFNIMSDDDLIPFKETDNMHSKGIQLPNNFVDRNLPQDAFADIPLHRDDAVIAHAMAAYNKFMMFPSEDKCFSMEEYMAYKWYKKHEKQNDFVTKHFQFWECGYDCLVRVPPMFVRQNESQDAWSPSEAFEPLSAIEDGKRAFAFNVDQIYADCTEYSKEELLQSRWINGDLRSQKENEMNVTELFDRKEEIYKAQKSRRSTIIGGRCSILPPLRTFGTHNKPIVTAVPGVNRKSILPTKSTTGKAIQVVNTLEPGNASTERTDETRQSQAKRKSLPNQNDEPRQLADDTSSPPIHRRKLEQPDKDCFKAPQVPLMKPRVSPIYNDEDNEINSTVCTQTFNIFLKQDLISTPIGKSERNAIRPEIFVDSENLSPIRATTSTDENGDKKRLPFGNQTATELKEMKESDTNQSRYPPTSADYFVRQKLSAIMETTEDTSSRNTISSTATTTSSKSSVEDFDFSKHASRTTTDSTLKQADKPNIDSQINQFSEQPFDLKESLTINRLTAIDRQPDQLGIATTLCNSMVSPVHKHSDNNVENQSNQCDLSNSMMTSLRDNIATTGDNEPKTADDSLEFFLKSPPFRNSIIPSMSKATASTSNIKTDSKLLSGLSGIGQNDKSIFNASDSLFFKDKSISLPVSGPKEHQPDIPVSENVFCIPNERTETIPISKTLLIGNESLLPIGEKTGPIPNIPLWSMNSTVNTDIKPIMSITNETQKLPTPSNASAFGANQAQPIPDISKLEINTSMRDTKGTVLFEIYEDRTEVIPRSAVTRNEIERTFEESYRQFHLPLENVTISTNEKTSNTLHISALAATDATENSSTAIKICGDSSQETLAKNKNEEDDKSSLLVEKKVLETLENINISIDAESAIQKPERQQSNQTIKSTDTSSINDRSRFSVENPNTEMFNFHLPTIKNSTLLPETVMNIPQESIHIKEEPVSLLPASTKSQISEQFIDLGEEVRLSIDLMENETEFKSKNDVEKKAEVVASNFLISAPVTIRPSVFNRIEIPDDTIQSQTMADVIVVDDSGGARATVDNQSEANNAEQALDVTFCPTQIDNWDDDGSTSGEHGNEYVLNHMEVSLIDREHIGTNFNPFDTDLQYSLLQEINIIDYISNNVKTCKLINRVSPIIPNKPYQVADEIFNVRDQIGRGSFGLVYKAVQQSTGKLYALKQERPANLWEYYICLEIKSRIEADHMLSAFMNAEYALIGNNASVLATEYSSYGTILDVCNRYKSATKRNFDEVIVMHMATQMLSIVDHLHGANIIHGDIKPDNFLFMRRLSTKRTDMAIQLIDFGRAIDMNFFDKNQQFTIKIETKDFVCTEMLDGRPWTYQSDLFCLVGTIYSMLIGKYMKVERQPNGDYGIVGGLPAYLNVDTWTTIFNTLINIRNCNSMPDLQDIRLRLKEAMPSDDNIVKEKMAQFNSIIG